MSNAIQVVNEWNSSRTIFYCLVATNAYVVLAALADLAI